MPTKSLLVGDYPDNIGYGLGKIALYKEQNNLKLLYTNNNF
jgi:hypothetical protein